MSAYTPREDFYTTTVRTLTEGLIEGPAAPAEPVTDRRRRPRSRPRDVVISEGIAAALAVIREDRLRRPSDLEQVDADRLDLALTAGTR